MRSSSSAISLPKRASAGCTATSAASASGTETGSLSSSACAACSETSRWALRLSSSIRWLRDTRYSHAEARSGVPFFGHASSAAISAACTASSADSVRWKPNSRASRATSRPYSCRNACSTSTGAASWPLSLVTVKPTHATGPASTGRARRQPGPAAADQ
jgi:hypothetical protein